MICCVMKAAVMGGPLLRNWSLLFKVLIYIYILVFMVEHFI